MSDDLVKRLRGQYAIGPHMPNGEPEFGWRQFEAPPIQHDAADRIEALTAENERLRKALALYSCEDGCNDCPVHERDQVGCGWTARQALATLRGEGET